MESVPPLKTTTCRAAMSKAVPMDLPYDALPEMKCAAVAAATIGASGSVSNGVNNV